MNKSSEDAKKLLARYNELNQLPLTFKRIQEQSKIVNQLTDYDSIDHYELLDEVIQSIERCIEKILKRYPYDTPKGEEILLEAWDSWDPHIKEILADYLSEWKYKKPELYHPVWDRLIALQ